MSLRIRISRNELRKVIGVEESLKILCEETTTEENFFICVPQRGKLIDVLSVLRTHQIPYDLENDHIKGLTGL